MDEDLKEIKKKVVEDWQNAFPQLTLFAQNKFYKIVGPILTGLELIKLPRSEEYRPHFVIYSLWGNRMGNDLKAALYGPILLREFYNNKGFQFSIPYVKHSVVFTEMLECVRKQMPLSLTGDVFLKDLLAVFDEHSKKSFLAAAPNSYLQAELYAFKMYLALYAGNTAQIQSLVSEIEKKNWDLVHFAMCKVDYNSWLKNLRETADHRSEFMSRIEINKQDKKLSKLQYSELKP